MIPLARVIPEKEETRLGLTPKYRVEEEELMVEEGPKLLYLNHRLHHLRRRRRHLRHQRLCQSQSRSM
jgi:hypothetical protein